VIDWQSGSLALVIKLGGDFRYWHKADIGRPAAPQVPIQRSNAACGCRWRIRPIKLGVKWEAFTMSNGKQNSKRKARTKAVTVVAERRGARKKAISSSPKPLRLSRIPRSPYRRRQSVRPSRNRGCGLLCPISGDLFGGCIRRKKYTLRTIAVRRGRLAYRHQMRISILSYS
jgi:hypothetical protein